MVTPRKTRATFVGAGMRSGRRRFNQPPSSGNLDLDAVARGLESLAKQLAVPGAEEAAREHPGGAEVLDRIDADLRRLRDLMSFANNGRGKLKKYGLDEDAFWAIVDDQHFRCPICRTEFLAEGPRMVVDHNHATGEVRAVLCNSCNTGLGQLKDSPDVLRRAVIYLESWGYYGPDLKDDQ